MQPIHGGVLYRDVQIFVSKPVGIPNIWGTRYKIRGNNYQFRQGRSKIKGTLKSSVR